MQRVSPDSGLRSELGRLVHGALANPWAFDPWASYGESRRPRLAVQETDDGVIVRAELPGVDPESIDVSVTPEQLTLAVVKEATESSDHDQVGDPMSRHGFESLRHTLELPHRVDPEQVVATSRHGVLTVTLRKPAEAVRKRITVQAT